MTVTISSTKTSRIFADANLDMNNNRIINCADPQNAQDVVVKDYLDVRMKRYMALMGY